MSRLNRFRLVTFDLRDTLVRARNTPGRAFREIASTHGFQAENRQIDDSFNSAWSRLRNEHPNFGLGTGMQLKTWWENLIYQVFRTELTGPNDPRIQAIASNVEEMLTSPAQWRMCPGCLQILDYLQDHNVRMGVVSNFDSRLEKLVDRMGLKDYFAFILASYREGAEKPDQRIFNRALFLSRLPGIAAKDALHVGNEPSADYYGAKEAGWNAVLVSDASPEHIIAQYPNVQKNHVFKNLEELRKKWVEGSVKW